MASGWPCRLVLVACHLRPCSCGLHRKNRNTQKYLNHTVPALCMIAVCCSAGETKMAVQGCGCRCTLRTLCTCYTLWFTWRWLLSRRLCLLVMLCFLQVWNAGNGKQRCFKRAKRSGITCGYLFKFNLQATKTSRTIDEVLQVLQNVEWSHLNARPPHQTVGMDLTWQHCSLSLKSLVLDKQQKSSVAKQRVSENVWNHQITMQKSADIPIHRDLGFWVAHSTSM